MCQSLSEPFCVPSLVHIPVYCRVVSSVPVHVYRSYLGVMHVELELGCALEGLVDDDGRLTGNPFVASGSGSDSSSCGREGRRCIWRWGMA